MSTKPFKRVVDEQKEELKEENFVKPFKVQSTEPLIIDNLDTEEKDVEEPSSRVVKESFLKKAVHFLSSLSGIVVAFFVFIFMAVVADAINTIGDINSKGSVSEYIYLSALILLIVVFLMNIFANFKQIRLIKNVKNIQNRFKLQKSNPTQEIIPLSNTLLKHYENIQDPQLQEKIKIMREELNNSQIYKEIYNDIDNSLLPILDEKAKKLIHKASIQVALSTALSPVPMLDMILIVWRTTLLTKEIATLYGFKPSTISTLILLKQAVVNVAFAGIAELASDFANEVAGSSVLSKVSQSAGQGAANGILLARFGYGIMEVCRPIELGKKRDGFFKNIVKSIIGSFKSKESV